MIAFYLFFVMESHVTDQAGRLENTPLLPQRVKSGSIPGFALLSLRSRNRARSAFHTVFPTPSLINNLAFYYRKKDSFPGDS
jgi:hypothetical protein